MNGVISLNDKRNILLEPFSDIKRGFYSSIYLKQKKPILSDKLFISQTLKTQGFKV